MLRMSQIKGQLSVPWSLPDAFGLMYPRAFLFGEEGTQAASLLAASAPTYGAPPYPLRLNS